MPRRRYEYHGHYIVVDYDHDPLRIYVELTNGETKRTKTMRSAENAILRHCALMDAIEDITTQREET